jgi:uncharacterized protein (TIGR03435 family)
MMRVVGEVVVAMSSSFALALIVKATAVAAATLIAVRLARGGRASVRHLLLATAFFVLLALPATAFVTPSRDVGVSIGAPAATLGVETVGSVDETTSVSGSARSGGSPGILRALTVPSAVTLVLVAWLAGTTTFLVLMIGGLMRVRSLRRHGLPWREGEAMVADIAKREAMRRPVQLLVDDCIRGPMTCGVVRPAIVLPVDARAWDPEDLRRAVIHELEHIRRGDWLMLCVARVVCSLYWFHPLVWMSWRQLRLEAERACDDAVVCHARPEAYADQLVTLAERVASSSAQSVLAMASRGDLSARVSALLNDRQPRGRAGSRWFVAAAVAAVLLLAGIAPLRAVAIQQVSTADEANRTQALKFEAAVLRRNTSGTSGMQVDQQGNRYFMTNGNMRTLILNAYGPRSTELIGAPSWLDTERYDLLATFESSSTRDQVRAMLRAFLADRLKLSAHFEDRDHDVYVLSIARADGRLGSSIRPSSSDCAGVVAAVAAGRQTPSLAPADNGAPACGMRANRGEFLAGGITMDVLARNLGNRAGRIVIDRTGLTGYYQLTLKFSADAGTPADGDALSIFTALREQLGLKLDAGRAPIQTLVIDHVERPTGDQN